MNNQNSLDELADWILHEPSYTKAEMKDKIQVAINKTIMEARADELQRIVTEWYTNPAGEVRVAPGSLADQITDRLSELRQQLINKYGRADNEVR